MKGLMITIPNNQHDLSHFFDTNHICYFKFEELIINAITCILDDLNLNNLYVKELCHYTILNELIIENEKIDITELKNFYNKRFQTCLLKYNDYYNEQMVDLFYNIKNNVCLNKEQIIYILKLKLRNNICYFKLCNEPYLTIDFGEQCLFVQSNNVSMQAINKIKDSGLMVVAFDETEGYGFQV